jgi:hypothetical protein
MVGEIGIGEFAERISDHVGVWEIKSLTYYILIII